MLAEQMLSALKSPLLEPALETRTNSRWRHLPLLVVAGCVVALATASFAGGRLHALFFATAAVPPTPLLIFGLGGAAWSNGTHALSTPGAVSWATQIRPSARFPARALALAEEDTSVIVAWEPGSSQGVLRVNLTTLRRPVALRQCGQLLYVACFGVEDEGVGPAGRSGLAVVDMQRWAVIDEIAFGTHVHNVYCGDKGELFVVDVGDPWVAPPVLGGVHVVEIAADADLQGSPIRSDPRRLGPGMHARSMAVERAETGSAAGAGARATSRDGRGAAPPSDGAAAAPRHLHVLTQEPLGERTRVHSLRLDAPSTAPYSAGWLGRRPPEDAGDAGGDAGRGAGGGARGGAGDAHAPVHVAASARLPAVSLPGEGGADIFFDASGHRLFCTDRSGGAGALYELAPRGLAVLASAALGRGPRYTDTLGEPTAVYSLSTGDAMLTTVNTALGAAPETDGEVRLVVEARQPAGVAKPSFVVRWDEASPWE